MLYGWKENSTLTNFLAACAHLTITVSEIERDICEKNRHFIIPLAFDAPVRGVPVGILPSRVVWKNYNGVATRRWKNFKDMYNRWGTIPACDRQTDRRTDRRTDRQTDILPRHSPRYAYASRGKNDALFLPLPSDSRPFPLLPCTGWPELKYPHIKFATRVSWQQHKILRRNSRH